MRAVILAAGIASRLRPLTDHCPKCLLRIGQRPLLARTMDALLNAGIREFTVVTGYLHGQIEDYLQKNYAGRADISFIHNERYASTNNICSLYLACRDIAGRPAMLLDSDILFDPQIIVRLLASDRSDVLALNSHALGEEEMKVVTDASGRVSAISKTCDIRAAAGESIGIERMSAAYTAALAECLSEMMKEDLDNVFYEQAFERLIARGFSFAVEDVSDLFSMELDTVEDFRIAAEQVPPSLSD